MPWPAPARGSGTGERQATAAAGIAALSEAAVGHRHDPSDRAHRGADDGEPLLRQPAWHALPARRGRLQDRQERPADRRQPLSQRANPARVPHAHHVPVVSAAKPGVDGQPQCLRQRAHGRFRQHPDRPAIYGDRRRRGHGLLAGGGSALLLLAVPALPDRGPVLLLRPRPDLPQPPLPAGGDLDRADRRHHAALTDYPANGTIFDELDAHGITWKNYFSTTSSLELFPPLYLNDGTKILPIADFFTDAAAGALPTTASWSPTTGISPRKTRRTSPLARSSRRA